MYSQGEEEKYILEFFKDKNDGSFLDIGAYDGSCFSNTRQLALNGWSGVLVEPSKLVFPKLAELYKDNNKVECIQCAIGPYNGYVDFWDSAGACATAVEYHYDKWKDVQNDFELISVPMLTFMEFYKQFPYIYDFINIDCEGLDFDIIKQIDFNETNTSLLCIEYNYNSEQIFKALEHWKFKTIFTNAENMICTREV